MSTMCHIKNVTVETSTSGICRSESPIEATRTIVFDSSLTSDSDDKATTVSSNIQ